MGNILAPVMPPYSPELTAVMQQYPQQDDYLLTLFRVFANSMRFAKKAVPNLLDKGSPLVIREREIVVLRTTANAQCEYEWGVHVAIFASAAGFSEAQIIATKNGKYDDPVWNEKEKCLLASVDDLCRSGSMAEDNLASFQRFWSREEQMEILALCGTYHTVSFVANCSEIGLEDFAARFPAA
ncbi:carboxymuconolactone decarboxylase family protein [Sphingorhabdus sp. SMR4y]|uniref:carboxymuconolactone decarboxylase family protein n=1 Tax=Sphingorhabdus sp. SMR4y TaxID=2584094 RepID=UPI000B5D04FC|nr:carboxymuconolactone decarboxylase family protein [Sphingorhabdus sp. SMR4y]ASK89975.1 carboxymuconolactone decarboxylase [Sphingorhabdus sp. SMR4y]